MDRRKAVGSIKQLFKRWPCYSVTDLYLNKPGGQRGPSYSSGAWATYNPWFVGLGTRAKVAWPY